MKKNIKKRKKVKIKINLFNIIAILSVIGSAILLIHDLLVWAIIPMFTTHEFFMLTYFGFFVDMTAMFVLDTGWDYLKEEMEK